MSDSAVKMRDIHDLEERVVKSEASSLTKDWNERKDIPICSGVLDYFPDAIAEIAKVSKLGNDQHNPGQPMHWARGKSADHADCIIRHLIDRGSLDSEGARHTAKVAWRALALLQEELEDEKVRLLGISKQAASSRASKWAPMQNKID